jgi:hypothetical protein
MPGLTYGRWLCNSHITSPIRGSQRSTPLRGQGPAGPAGQKAPGTSGGAGTFKWQGPELGRRQGRNPDVGKPGRWTRDGRAVGPGRSRIAHRVGLGRGLGLDEGSGSEAAPNPFGLKSGSGSDLTRGPRGLLPLRRDPGPRPGYAPREVGVADEYGTTQALPPLGPAIAVPQGRDCGRLTRRQAGRRRAEAQIQNAQWRQPPRE